MPAKTRKARRSVSSGYAWRSWSGPPLPLSRTARRTADHARPPRLGGVSRRKTALGGGIRSNVRGIDDHLRNGGALGHESHEPHRLGEILGLDELVQHLLGILHLAARHD